MRSKARSNRKEAAKNTSSPARNTGIEAVKRPTPKTNNQGRILSSDKNQVVEGLAGTGKTYLALGIGLSELKERPKILIMRSAVPTRNLGHMKGDYNEKIGVYEPPYISVVNELCGRADAYETLKQKGVIEFDSTSYIRGNNWNNMTVIVDECQNMTFHELDSIITRAQDNVKLFFIGDQEQLDDGVKSGFDKFTGYLKQMPEYWTFTRLTADDIVRGKMMKQYILIKAGLSKTSA